MDFTVFFFGFIRKIRAIRVPRPTISWRAVFTLTRKTSCRKIIQLRENK